MKIMIDPGHRNNIHDYGAAGNGLKESAIALAISKKLKKPATGQERKTGRN